MISPDTASSLVTLAVRRWALSAAGVRIMLLQRIVSINVTLLISFNVVDPARTLSSADSRRKRMPSSRAARGSPTWVFSPESSRGCGRSNPEVHESRFGRGSPCPRTRYTPDLRIEQPGTIALDRARSPPGPQVGNARPCGRNRRSGAPVAGPECSSARRRSYRVRLPCSGSARARRPRCSRGR